MWGPGPDRYAERRLLVPRHEQRPCFGDPRPWRHLHDSDDGARARRRAHLAQPVAQACMELVARGLDELELLAHRCRELDRPGRSSTTGAGARAAWAERRPQPRPLGDRLAQRRRAPPGPPPTDGQRAQPCGTAGPPAPAVRAGGRAGSRTRAGVSVRSRPARGTRAPPRVAGGRLPRTRALSPPRASPRACRPSRPSRSATAPPGSAASSPRLAHAQPSSSA